MSPVGRRKSERLGYPTQKPLALLNRIIQVSSNPGDIVLDPFCGCGTTVEAAANLNRQFIGIDIASFALDLIRERRLENRAVPIIGVPLELEDAAQMVKEDAFSFEKWAIERIPGLLANQVQVGDGGIDGRGRTAYPLEGTEANLVLAQVKGGEFKPNDLRAFRGVMAGEAAALGIFITLHKVGGAAAGATPNESWPVSGCSSKVRRNSRGCSSGRSRNITTIVSRICPHSPTPSRVRPWKDPLSECGGTRLKEAFGQGQSPLLPGLAVADTGAALELGAVCHEPIVIPDQGLAVRITRRVAQALLRPRDADEGILRHGLIDPLVERRKPQLLQRAQRPDRRHDRQGAHAPPVPRVVEQGLEILTHGAEFAGADVEGRLRSFARQGRAEPDGRAEILDIQVLVAVAPVAEDGGSHGHRRPIRRAGRRRRGAPCR